MSISDTSGGRRSRREPGGRSDSTRVIVPEGWFDDAELEVIGFDPGAGGRSAPPPPPPRPDIGFDPGIVNPGPPLDGERPCARWVIWEAWFTMHDERVCPECGPLHGQRFQRGLGPRPPLHGGCRCFRREVHRECVTR